MKIDLEVLACTSIKRRKPWPLIQWVGKEKEILLLLDENRVSVLYIPSGKTKRKIPKLSPLCEESLILSRSPNGYYLAGVLKSGDIFLWNKDKDLIKTITGLSDNINLTSLLTEKCMLFTSDDCSKILLVVGYDKYFVWRANQTTSIFDVDTQVLNGQWNSIQAPANVQLPSSDCLETSAAGTFYNSQICGCCCQWSVTFNHGTSVCVSTLLLRFPSRNEIITENSPAVRVEWCCLQYPVQNINPGCEPISSRGAYVTCYSRDGQILAVAVNQRSPVSSAMLFVSPLTDTVLVSELRGCGLKEPEKRQGRQYWVRDMTWTVDGLFLACILNNGSVALLSRLGEPLALQISGSSLDMGPNYFLPVHPLIQLQSDDGRNVTNEVMSMNDPMAQKFSVTSHSSLPILLFSDGYNVTLVQLPGELTSATFMTDLLLESTKHLEYLKTQGNLDMTLVNAYNLSDRKNGSRKGGKIGSKTSTADRLKQFLSNLDDADVSLNETQASELSVLLDDEYQYGGMQEMTSGKIMFGENEQHLATMDGSFANMGEKQALFKHFQRARLNLFTVWKLAATCTESWTSRLDSITKDTVKNIYKMFTLMINSVPVTDMLAAQNTSAQNSALVNVITMYRQLLDVLQFDSLEQHLIPSTLQLAHKTITLVLNNKTINQSDPRLKTLSGCYMLLKFTEKVMNRNYIWLPRSLVEKGLSPRSMLERPDQCVPVSKTSNKAHVGVEVDVKSVAVIPSDQLSARRLTGTWKLLYQALLEFRRDQSISEADVQQSQLLVDAIHQTLQTVDTDIPGQSHNVNPGDAYSLDGQYTHALDVWLQQYRSLQGERGYSKSAKLLHSLLYTFILRGELLTAVDFIDELVVKANTKSGVIGQTLKGDVRPALMTIVTTTMRTQGSSVNDIVPCIRDKGIRQVVQTMARFMAAYFTNQSIYIFPPHNPQPLPAVHFNTPLVNNRIIPQYPEEITQIIRHQKLSDVWTVERTLEYLLLSGLVCEATWFAVKMGDWKAGYLLSVACEQHKQTASTLYTKPRKPLTLPEHLRPTAILQDRLNVLFGGSLDQDPVLVTNDTDLVHLTQTIKELLTAGIMCKVEVVPWLLDGLIHKLKKVVKNLYPLVPSDFYLPSPPLYCPQPTHIKQHASPPSLEREEKIREQISSLIQLILSVLSGSHLSLPCITWYTQQLISIQEKAKQFRANTEGPCSEVPSILQQYQSLTSHLSQYIRNYSTQHVLTCFRDFCSLLWLLHARDKLSLKLREKEKFLNRLHTTQSKGDLEDKDQQAWLQECFTALQWAVHLLSFCHYLPDESSLYKVVLSLLMELPPSEDTADILAEHYYDFENLDPEIQEKLEKILHSWEGVIVTPEDDGKSANKELNDDIDSGTDVRKSVTFYGASPRGKSLATYFSKQCQAVTKVLKKKGKTFGSFEEFVFNSGGEKTQCHVDLNIGSRQFETKQSYFEFLDTFAAVSFEKLLDLERSVNRPRDLPLLGSFADAIISRELAVFSERDFTSAEKKKYSLIVMSASRSSSRSSLAFARSQSILTQKYNSNLSLNQEPSPRSKPQGLFRSKSVVEDQNKQGVVKRFNSEGGLDVLVEDSPSKSFFDHSQKSPRKGSQQNVTNLASKFSQSEDLLYKPDVDANNSWSLDVKFGRKYKLLQLLLEWLEAWCRKNHSFGLGQQDIFDSHPTIKIQIPAQLILLSLWLLENKYNPNTYAIQDVGQGFISEPQERKKKIKKKLRQPSIEKQHTSPVRSPVRSQLEQSLRNSRSHPDQFVRKSNEETNKTTTSEDGIRNAYKHILEGDADDESCGSESTLQSYDLNGEIKQSLSVIRGTGSPTREDLSFLNRTVYPDTSPERNNSASPNTSTPVSKKKGKARPTETVESLSLRRKTTTSTQEESLTSHRKSRDKKSSKNVDRASSPSQSKNSPLERSSILKASLTSSLERSTSPTSTKIHTQINARSISPQMSMKANRSRSRSPDTKGQQGHVSRRQSYNESPHFDSGFNSSLANQLQNIVRSEMRRIMEVQHHSLMAMMGAIDDKSVSSLPAQHRVLREPPQRQQQSTRHRSPDRRHDSSYNPADNSMNLDELETSLRRGSNKLDKKGPVKVDRVLQELKYLQHENVQPVASGSLKSKPSHGKENNGFPLLRLDNNHHVVNAALNTDPNNVNLIPKFLRMTAERDTNQPKFFFPKIPQEAWSEHQAHHKQPREPIQLLKLQSFPHSQFKNLANKIPIVPPPPSSVGQPPQRSIALSKDPKHRFGIPLLRLQETKPPYIELGKESHLGQFVDPEQLLSPEQLLQKVESEKQKIQMMKEQTEEEIQTKKIVTTKKRSKVIKVKQTSEEDIIQEEEDEESETEEQGPLHDGYAIKPGAFDHHLRLDEILGSEADTDTRFQYLLALKMKEQRQKKKKVDFSTMTKEMIDAIAEPDPVLEAESARRADAWTSITKDTGSDPIQEAVIEYNKRQHGRMLPPDIYLKLGFNEGEEGENQARGRSYLNVVDIRASDVFNDIPDRDDKQQPDEAFQPSSTRHQDIGETEELLRESLEPVLPPRHYGYDRVTAKMLDRKNRYTNQDSLYLGILPRESMRYSKTSLIKRLRELNDQVAAIDEMSNNIEQDFESSRRIMSTLERLDEAGHPGLTNREIQLDRARDEAGHSRLTDREIQLDRARDEIMTSSKEDKPKPTISPKSPVASARKSARTTTRRSAEKNKQTEDVRLSGLSDLSDIIGEVLLEGGVDLEATGLSHEEAEALKFKAESRRVIYGSTGVETLEELIHKTDATDDKEEKRRVLQKWMANHHVKQQDEYRERLDKLREQEIHPYRPAGGFDSTFTGKEIETQTRERQEIRRQQEAQFMRQRLLEAERLMGDILVDQPAPSLLPVPSPRQPLTPKSERAKPPKLASKFSATRTIKKSPPPKKTALRSVRKAAELKIKAKEWENMKPSVSSIRTKWRVDGRVSGTSITPQPAIIYQKRQEEYERRMKEEKLAEIAQKYNMEDLELELLESEEYLPSAHTSSDLMEYVRQMAQHESPEDLHRELSPDERRARIEYKPKPFTKLVKLQRPEVTRKDIQPRPSESYVDRLATLTPRDASHTDRSDRSSTDIKEIRTGPTPAITRSSTQPEISGIRRVKSYAERLQEMKPKHKYSTPLVPRQSLGGTSSHAMSSYRPSKPVGPAHKPVTYVQQLQKINREASTSKFKGKRSTPIPVRTVMRSHKPIHKPKTYVEQLKTINSEAPETIKRRALMQKTRTLQPGVIREQGRSRPYRDPYHDLDGDELHSVLSSWSVDDDVKKLLYDDDHSVAYTAYGAGTSQEYQISEGMSDYYEAVMADQYANSVDIDEITRIAEEASVDSGSVLSVIDWDRVDELIADVNN